MKIMFVAPRYHTNYVPIVNGLVSQGNEIMYCVRYEGATEDHQNVNLCKIKASIFSKIIERIIKKIDSKNIENKMIGLFIPNINYFKNIIYKFNPDILIIRDRNIFTLVAYLICKTKGVNKCILYNQSPLFIESKHKNIFIKIKEFVKVNLFPKKVITVVEYANYPNESVTYVKEDNTYFLPFVPRNQDKRFIKDYFKNNIVNILDIGKYRQYKNHKVLIDAIKIIVRNGYSDFHVTIIGQVKNNDEIEIYKDLNCMIKENNLSKFITLLKEIEYKEINKYFYENDIYVLPSKDEVAAISNVDAMSYGLAVISTNKNGTASYIRNEIDGFIFENNNAIDLANKISKYLNDRNLIIKHGESGRERAKQLYSFEKYYDKFLELIK